MTTTVSIGIFSFVSEYLSIVTIMKEERRDKVGSRISRNKPKGLKVAKEDQRSMGLMVDRLDGQ